MSLNSEKQTAINEFIQLMTEMRTKEDISDQEYAQRFFALMEKWITKATIKYTTGLTAPNGAVTGIFNGNLE